MNREEAIYFANCLKNNYTVDLNDMEAFCDMAIKALEQEPVLDKIKAEILEEHESAYAREDYDTAYGLGLALAIIDKYKSESENA